MKNSFEHRLPPVFLYLYPYKLKIVEATKEKSIQIEHPVTHVIHHRKSVRAYNAQPIEPEKIKSLFEAVRWAPSANNEQPWTYIYATKEQSELWSKLFDALNDTNKLWAKDASLLIVSMARKNFQASGKPNFYALYDLGAANSFLALQAVELGLQLRQMGGYDKSKAKANLNISDEFELGAMIAVGYPGSPDSLPEVLRERELTPRGRFRQHEFALNKTF